MPGSPERILLRNPPNVTEEMLAGGTGALGPRQAALPGPVRRLHRGRRPRATSATRSSPGAQPVTDVIASAFWPTIILFGLGELIAIVVGLALGAYTGWKRGGPVDYVGNGVSLDPLLDAVLPARA